MSVVRWGGGGGGGGKSQKNPGQWGVIKICNIVGNTQARARSARAGGGSGRGVSPLRDEGAFAFLRLKLNDLVHTLGGFSWGNCQ